jgi:hypothetical protein
MTDLNIIDVSLTLPRHPTKRSKWRKKSDIKRVVIHTTDINSNPWALARYDIGPNHISLTGCPCITYANIIMDSGLVYRTLAAQEVSWHVGMWNFSSLGVALMYKCSDDKGVDSFGPTQEALNSLYALVAKQCLELKLEPDCVVGHRELEYTGFKWINLRKSYLKSCPGWKVDMDSVRFLVTLEMQSLLKRQGFYRGKIDGDFGPLSKAALAAYYP